MKPLALAFACVLATCPPVASAGLSLRIGPNQGGGQKNADLTIVHGWGPRGERFFDLTFHEEGPPDDECLFAYELLFLAPPGINLVRAEAPPDWVFAGGGAKFTQVKAGPRDILVHCVHDVGRGRGSDITRGKKAARVYFTIDRALTPGRYAITLDAAATVFATADPDRPLVIPVTITDPGLVIVSRPIVRGPADVDAKPSERSRPLMAAGLSPGLCGCHILPEPQRFSALSNFCSLPLACGRLW